MNSISENKRIWSLLGVFVFLLFLEMPRTWLFDPGESRYAEISREMLVTHDVVTPRLDGSHYFEKPPLLYWVDAGAMKILGPTPYAARLPARVAVLGTAILLISALTTASAPTAGLWSALFFLSAPLSFVLGRVNLTDGVLSFFLTLALLSLRAFLKNRHESKSTFASEMGIGFGMAGAMMTKGLVGVLFPGLVLVLWCALFGSWKRISALLFSIAPLIFLALAVPWFFLVEQSNPGFARFFFIHEHFQRFATDSAKREAPFYFFALTFLWGFLPWLIPFFKGIRSSLRFDRARLHPFNDELFFALWFLSVLVFFSFSKSKLIPYLLPAFPAAAALAGKWFASPSTGTSKPFLVQAIVCSLTALMGIVAGVRSNFFSQYDLTLHGVFIAALIVVGVWSAWFLSRKSVKAAFMAQAASWAGVFFVLILAMPHVTGEYSDHDLAVAAAKTGARQILAYEYYPQTLPLVLARTIPVVGSQGELASDGVRSPDLFWSDQKFWGIWNSDELVAVCLRNSSLERFSASPKKPFVIARNRHEMIVTNFAPKKNV